jgi:hypothetical protein
MCESILDYSIPLICFYLFTNTEQFDLCNFVMSKIGRKNETLTLLFFVSLVFSLLFLHMYLLF